VSGKGSDFFTLCQNKCSNCLTVCLSDWRTLPEIVAHTIEQSCVSIVVTMVFPYWRLSCRSGRAPAVFKKNLKINYYGNFSAIKVGKTKKAD